MSLARPLGVLVCAVGMSGCGGGGGGGGSTPPPTQPPPPAPPPTTTDEDAFVEASDAAGLNRRWEFPDNRTANSFPLEFSGGIAAADYDADGDVDLYVVGGETEPNHLFRNDGDGTFQDVAASVGLAFTHLGSGPAFADIDGDSDLDLFIGAVEGDPYYLLENQGGTFVDVTARSGIVVDAENTVSATFADYDGDGDLDLFLAHWGFPQQADTQTVWRNSGDGIFESASIETGIAAALIIESTNYNNGETAWIDRSLTPNLSDLDDDGDADLLMAADYDTSQVFRNNGDGTFTRTTDRSVIVDQSGMGAAVGDYDNDGDFDWFVSSIYEEPDFFGNRLYRNEGGGVFHDATDAAGIGVGGIKDGGWGWASCFVDVDNDGHLDIVHVNGWPGDTGSDTATPVDFNQDQMRLFHAQGDGTFRRSDTNFGITDRGQGRALACFDADRDGDIDLVVSNNEEDNLVYYRNELDAAEDNHHLAVKLAGSGGNRHGIGAKVTVTTNNGTQVRELRGGNNYASHNPFEVHFGLADATVADVVVRWPNGAETSRLGVTVDQLLTIEQD